jgi:N-acetylglucosamine-6-sulfatase
MRRRTLSACIGFAVLLIGLAVAVAPATAAERPNLVLITTDDQPLSTFEREYMPRTFRRLVDRGTSFDDAVLNVPVCCPSRATLLTGQYPHNHGVLTNDPGYGALSERRNVLPEWLRRAGYRTGHFGKWLHGYERVAGVDPAPGWDRWYTQLNRRRYYDYSISVDGRKVKRRSKPKHHLTNVMTRGAVRFARKELPRRRPLFLQLDYYAPHPSSNKKRNGDPARCDAAPEPLRRDKGTVRDRRVPRVPSFNERDMSDKPVYNRVSRLDRDDRADLDRRYRCTLESLAGVDRGIKRLMQEFRRAGELRNTAFVFLTDNGYLMGEHRVKGDKARAWEAAIRTPLVIRLPAALGVQQEVVSEQAAQIDITATLLELAGADPCLPRRCRTIDGRSLLPAALGDPSALRDRAVLIEMDDSVNGERPRSFACAFQALRTGDEILIENTITPDPRTRRCEESTVYEHYDLLADPYQLDNLAPLDGTPPGARQLQLQQRLADLRACAGIAGRDPEPPGGHCE